MSTFIPHTKAELREKQRYGDLIHKAQEKEAEEERNRLKAINEVIEWAKEHENERRQSGTVPFRRAYAYEWAQSGRL